MQRFRSFPACYYQKTFEVINLISFNCKTINAILLCKDGENIINAALGEYINTCLIAKYFLACRHINLRHVHQLILLFATSIHIARQKVPKMMAILNAGLNNNK